LQARLAGSVVGEGAVVSPRYIAGVDVSAGRFTQKPVAAVIVLDWPGLTIAEVQTASGELNFPYIPGFLSFREMPLVIKAFEKLTITPDLVMVDGQGVAHPRRLGIASHLGLFLDLPTIGCAKSHLIGDFDSPGETRGSVSYLTDKGDGIGAVVRTKDRVKPLFISTGNRINLDGAIKWTLDTCRGYRLPEPTRLAHLAAGGNLNF
jgi:deoxyribonuclease V